MKPAHIMEGYLYSSNAIDLNLSCIEMNTLAQNCILWASQFNIKLTNFYDFCQISWAYILSFSEVLNSLFLIRYSFAPVFPRSFHWVPVPQQMYPVESIVHFSPIHCFSTETHASRIVPACTPKPIELRAEMCLAVPCHSSPRLGLPHSEWKALYLLESFNSAKPPPVSTPKNFLFTLSTLHPGVGSIPWQLSHPLASQRCLPAPHSLLIFISTQNCHPW